MYMQLPIHWDLMDLGGIEGAQPGLAPTSPRFMPAIPARPCHVAKFEFGGGGGGGFSKIP